MTTMLFSILICTIFTTVRACMTGGNTGTGGGGSVACPNIVGDTNFTLQKFTGEWYAIYTTNQTSANTTKCARINFGEVNDGLIATEVKQDSTTKQDLSRGLKYTQDSSAKYKFQLSVASSCGFKASTLPVSTIITDYTSYAMIYSCSVQKGALVENGLLLSRTTSISDDVRNKTTSVIRTSFYPLVQSECGC